MKEDERAKQAERETALQGKLAAMEKQMAELMAQLGRRDRVHREEVDALKAQLAEAKAREAIQAQLAEEARKREAERLAELRRQEEEARAKQEAEREATDERIRPGRILRDADWSPEMVVLPRGQFLMGAPASEKESGDHERPQHRVGIAYPLALGRYAVTNGEFRRFCPEHNSGEGFNADRQPVVGVHWEDTRSYIEWLNRKLGLAGKPECYRLPTEAEWEYGCRAGTTEPYSFSGSITAEKANYDARSQYENSPKGRYRQTTVEVGSLPANPWGLHEMHGNVWEWTEDCWHGSYAKVPADGRAWGREKGGDCGRRVLRGGSWTNNPSVLRSANRDRSTPGDRNSYIGFRLARTLP